MTSEQEKSHDMATPNARTVSLLGCGWLGIPVGQRLVFEGHKVLGSTTTPARLSVLSSMGIEPTLLRLEPEEEEGSVESGLSTSLSRFFSSPSLLLNIPPSTAFGPTYHLGQIEALLQRLPRMANQISLQHLLYVSSTAVYGSHQGEVDETSPLEPDAGSGEILVEAEARLRVAAENLNFGLTIVRPGGLIGMGRHPGRFLAGRTGLRAAEEPVNLVHQLDLADCLVALLTKNLPARGETRIYNAVARSHPTRRAFYTRASQLLGLAPPVFAESGKTETAARETGRNSGKIVRAERIRTATGVSFRFDDLEASLEGRQL